MKKIKCLGLLTVITLLIACGGSNDSINGDEEDGDEDQFISSVDQSNCSDLEICGDIGKLDCGSSVDGPLYYFNLQSEQIISVCGGACFLPEGEQQLVCATMCPPVEWDCQEDTARLYNLQ